jgi:hypothetical protein
VPASFFSSRSHTLQTLSIVGNKFSASDLQKISGYLRPGAVFFRDSELLQVCGHSVCSESSFVVWTLTTVCRFTRLPLWSCSS